MMMRRLILLSVAAAASFAIAACEQAITPTIAGLGGQVSTDTSGGGPSTSALVIIPTTLQLGVGATFQFGTNAALSQRSQIEWGSLDPSIVAISPAGLATAIAPGVATITARFSFDTTHVAIATVTVSGTALGSRGASGTTSGM